MATIRLTMIGAYNFNPDIFTNLDLPDGLDRETVINNILLRCGESPLLYDNPDFIKLMIGTWSKKWKPSIERMITALNEEYNPIHNFDRYEKTTDNRTIDHTFDKKTKTEYNSTISEDNTIDNDGSIKGQDLTENDVSAFNTSEYQPNNKTSYNTSSSTSNKVSEDKSQKHKGDDTVTSNDKDLNKDDLIHDGHLYGNIGTTKSQDMVIDEVNLRKKINIYDVIAEMFYNEFCIYVY